MSGIIQVNVSRENGTYTAEGVNIPVVTQADTFQELEANIREAVEIFFEGEEPSSLGFAPSPSILTNFELPAVQYGGKA